MIKKYNVFMAFLGGLLWGYIKETTAGTSRRLAYEN